MDEKGMVENVVDGKDEEMTIEQNWAFGVRVVENNKNKKAELFVKVKSNVETHELNQCVRDKCMKENAWISLKTTMLKNVKRIGMIVGACVPYVTQKWHQQQVIEVAKEEELNTEIKTEKCVKKIVQA